MGTRHYSDLFEIDDSYRRLKYLKLLSSSIKNDLNKWTEIFPSHIELTRYISPDYNNTYFIVDIIKNTTIAYVKHKTLTPPIFNRFAELISEYDSELKDIVQTLRDNIFTPEIYELDKIIGNQHSRKEKLDSLDIEQTKEIIEDTYQDWLKNSTEISAKFIAKIMYSYRRHEDIYNLWLDKFKDLPLVMSQLTSLKG